MSVNVREEGWQLTGSSAEAYERYLVPAIMRAEAARLVALADPQPGERVLDVGSGTGIVARTAAPRVGSTGRVVGLDLNPDMLEVARRVSAGSEPLIEWREGSADDLPYADTAFDVVLCQFALMFFSDRPRALAEMRRVLAPSGRVGLVVPRPLSQNEGFRTFAEVVGRHTRPQVTEGFHSIFAVGERDQMRELVTGAGFSDVHITIDVAILRYPSAEEMLRREAASSPMAGLISSLDPGVRLALIADLTAALDPFTDDDGVAIPFGSHHLLASG